MNLRLQWIDHLSAAYALAVALRRDVLRKPLGLEFTEAQLASESDSLHLACWDGDVLVGALMLTPRGQGAIQMRQVAVDDRHQKSGIGRWLVLESETEARRLGFSLILLHARDTAIGFYEKLGYTLVGQPFSEVGILHREMQKELPG